MRLAILLQSYGRFGGAERSALAHFNQLKRMNVDVSLFYSGTMSPEWTRRVNLHGMKIIPSQMTGFTRTPSMTRFLKQIAGFDKILIHHHVEPVLAFYLSKSYGKKIIWYSGSMFELAWEKFITGKDYRAISPTVRTTSTEFYGNIPSRVMLSAPLFNIAVQISRGIDIATVRGFRKIVANSNFLSKFLSRLYKLEKIPPVVYPGPDPIIEQISGESKTLIEQDSMVVVGPLIPIKNVDGIIRATSLVPPSKLILIGEGQEKNNLTELASRLGVSLEIRGTCLDEAELARAYLESKFLVHLSLYEPFGLTPVEAGLFSKPSIVTSHGGPSETIVNGETGYVVNPLNTNLVALRMKELLGNIELRREMGRKARINILNNFGLEASARNLLAEVESC